MLILGYSSIYTSLPVISLLYDEDTDYSNVIKFPTMYKQLQKGRELNIKAFLYWLLKSIFQAGVIMTSAVLWFENGIHKISTVTFTSLIFAELLNVYSQINTIKPIMLYSLFITLISYICSLIFFKSLLDVSYLSIDNLLKISLATLISWFPFYIYNSLRQCLWPEVHEKINNMNKIEEQNLNVT